MKKKKYMSKEGKISRRKKYPGSLRHGEFHRDEKQSRGSSHASFTAESKEEKLCSRLLFAEKNVEIVRASESRDNSRDSFQFFVKKKINITAWAFSLREDDGTYGL